MIDTLIIGGGAAGLYLASLNNKVTILERDICGRKLLLTGGGRCNYTRASTPDEMIGMYNGNRNFIKSVLYAHTPDDIVKHFKALGIEPSIEEDGKIFPKNGNAEDVRAALFPNKANIIEGKGISIKKDEDFFAIATESGEVIKAKRVVVATGGESFPGTGSDGNGYRLLSALGHTIIPTSPALSPIALTPSLSHAEGVSIRATLTVGKKSEENDIVITRRGISGPGALNISRHLADYDEITISFSSIDKTKLRMESGGKSVKNALHLPSRLTEALLGPLSDKRCGNLSKSDLETIEKKISRHTFKAKAIKEGAMNTRGGVSTSEINPRTMESKIVKNLYILGDLIDVDGPTGGYSLSFAFATAWIANNSLS